MRVGAERAWIDDTEKACRSRLARVQFSLHAGLPGPHASRAVRFADRGRPLRRGLPLRPDPQSLCFDLWPCLRASVRNGLPPREIRLRRSPFGLSRDFSPSATARSRAIPIDVFSEKPPVTRPEKVAVVGSGPAGLSAAHDLALLGYAVTVFEAAAVPGGMLHLGIPEYRLPRDVLQAQIREILDLGPELRLNARLGKDFTLESLRAQGYKAILLAFGLHRSRDLGIPGQDMDGVVKGIDFLLNVNLGYRFSNRQASCGDRRRQRGHRCGALGASCSTED